MSDAQKALLSKAQSNRSEEHRKNLSKALTGLKRSDETKKNISDGLTGIKRSDETKARMSRAQIARFQDPEEIKKLSESLIGRKFSDEGKKNISEGLIAYYQDPEVRMRMSDAMKNSNPHAIAMERQRGGHDIVQHHYLYDDVDLSKHTMSMTRYEHVSMHNRMRLDGYEVPHINSREDDNGLWGYNNIMEA